MLFYIPEENNFYSSAMRTSDLPYNDFTTPTWWLKLFMYGLDQGYLQAIVTYVAV
jgi:hypothetical protein